MEPRLLPQLPWMGLGVIGLHNLEEALTAPSWLPPHAGAIQSTIGALPPSIGQGRFYAALAALTVASAIWIILARKARPKSLSAYSLVVLFGMYFANALVPHVAGVVAFRGYVPGVVTAVAVVIPFFILFAIAGVRSDHFTRRGVVAAIAMAVIVYALAGLIALEVLRSVPPNAG